MKHRDWEVAPTEQGSVIRTGATYPFSCQFPT